jgi:glutathione synthase/RimK-type ligase-like ATP-grasp enzyme
MDIDAQGCVSGQISQAGRRYHWRDIHAMYLRPYNTQQILGKASKKLTAAVMKRDQLLSAFADLGNACVLNRPQAMASNHSKPYQLGVIRTQGFEVPEITTDVDAARDFWQRHGRVIYKSISGTRSIVRSLGAEEMSRLEDVAHAPTQFQAYVPGTDVRVHVIDGECHATAIDSGADDYRYAQRQGHEAQLKALQLPEHIATACVKLSRTLGLTLSGIDLRRTPEGRWYCFEVNPSPAFTYYQQATGQELAQVIAKLLQRGT